jgi:hypothetical protein
VHVLEKLWKAAYVFHAEGSLEAELWVLDHTLQILFGQVSQVVKGLRQSVTKRKLVGIKRKTLRAVADYLYRNRARMRYNLNPARISVSFLEFGRKSRIPLRSFCSSRLIFVNAALIL